MTPAAPFTGLNLFPATIIPGDRGRLTADGNTLEVFQNGVSQFVYTTDGSYATGDVGIEALTPNFTFMGWQGGGTAGPPAPTYPSVLTGIPGSRSQSNLVLTPERDARTTAFL